MKKNLLFLGLLITVLALSSCKGDKSAYKYTSSGRPYELIVVIDLDLWERPAGRALFDVLATDVPGLPQPERSFKIMYTEPGKFNSTLKIIRNIIIADIQNIYTQAKFNVASDVYAAPQTILYIQAPNEEEFQEFVENNKQYIIDLFTRQEMNRQMALLEKKHSDMVKTKVNEMFGAQVWVPGELSSSKTGEDFFWTSTNTATSDMNFIIYSYPYTDTDTFTPEYFLNKRDSVMKVNMPGVKEGIYMTTDSKAVQTRPITVQGKYALEARGLWRMHGDMMGGPFVSHMRLDEVNNRVITSEIFIYSPDKLKRNLVRFMEASLYTLKLPEEGTATQPEGGQTTQE